MIRCLKCHREMKDRKSKKYCGVSCRVAAFHERNGTKKYVKQLSNQEPVFIESMRSFEATSEELDMLNKLYRGYLSPSTSEAAKKRMDIMMGDIINCIVRRYNKLYPV